MLLDLLAEAVADIPGVDVTATANDVSDAERLAALRDVDLLIIDRKLRTGDGMDVVRTMSARHPAMKCIVIAGVTSDFVCPSDLLDVIVAVIDKASACTALLGEIERVMRIPPTAERHAQGDGSNHASLTAREVELFAAIGRGLSTKEIAKSFGISIGTVETHRKAICRKMGVSGASLVRLAVLEHRAGRRCLPRAAEAESGIRARRRSS